MPADPAAAAVQDEKRVLRRAAKAARAVAAAGQSGAGLALCRHFLARVPLPAGAVVSGYWPLGDEIDPRPLMEALSGRGHALALPVIRAAGEPLDFRAWRPGDALEAAGFGTRQPRAQAAELRPRILLVPLLAFDAAGYRLGYGGGFYDRSLALLRRLGDTLAVGLAFSAQQVARVPREATDEPLDLVVTERGAVGPTA
ncbi:MAG: 5-formyltetrahydrofolate cyclo-ligase [Kiloniellaceae bacterium]